jgi:hypothetical protein
MRKKKRRPQAPRPDLTIAQILTWADDHHARTGRWPRGTGGTIHGTLDEKWRNVNQALFLGRRGLPPGSSVARLLAEHRGVRNRKALPFLCADEIASWAQAHHARTGEWPTAHSGPILEAPPETWLAVDKGLRNGGRGLPGGSSLPRLLEERFGRVNHLNRPPLDVQQILAWADAYRALTGRWPTRKDGPIAEAPGESWSIVDSALLEGGRGLPGGSSLPHLLHGYRRTRYLKTLPELQVWQIVLWAKAHHARTGRWPGQHAGPVVEAPGETWRAIESALRLGLRGLPGGSSVAQVLTEYCHARNTKRLPPLTEEKILAWADAYHQELGAWPEVRSDFVPQAPGEKWRNLDQALRTGRRGLPGGSSLAQLLAARRGVRNRKAVPLLRVTQIINWAQAHHRRTGKWPTGDSGPIADAPGETWTAIDLALHRGTRGLPGGSSLSQLLNKTVGMRRYLEMQRGADS